MFDDFFNQDADERRMHDLARTIESLNGLDMALLTAAIVLQDLGCLSQSSQVVECADVVRNTAGIVRSIFSDKIEDRHDGKK